MEPSILAALIQAVGVITAALIGVLKIGQIVEKNVSVPFFSYSEGRNDLRRLLRKARRSLVFVVVYGDKLLERYLTSIESCLKRGVRVQFLMLDWDAAVDMDERFFGKDRTLTYDGVSSALDKLEGLSRAYGELLELRTFDRFLTASYIGADIYEEDRTARRDALIQIMLYQFGVNTPNAPIAYLSAKQDPVHFARTADSIEAMWEAGTPLDFARCRAAMGARPEAK